MIFFLLCASPFGVGMPNPGERLGFNLVCKKCSPQNYKRGGGKIRVGGSCPKYPPQISPVFPRFPPRFPRFSSVFPRFSPFSPVFPRFSPFFPATGNQTPIGYGNLGPLYWGLGVRLGNSEGWWKPQKVGDCGWSRCPRNRILSHVAKDMAYSWFVDVGSQSTQNLELLGAFLGRFRDMSWS